MMSFAEFLRTRRHVPEKSIPWYVKRVEMYQRFAKNATAGTPTIESFLQDFTLNYDYEDWQVEQAQRALQLYSRYQAEMGQPNCAQKATSSENRHSSPSFESNIGRPIHIPPATGWKTLEQDIGRLMRLKHLSYRTQKSYLSWMLRFKAFVHGKP
jgi:hypothetical protein